MAFSHDDDLIQLPDGRRLGYRKLGPTDGVPFLYCHGWPGSRLEAVLFADSARDQGVQLITVDRPGMGLSDYQPERRISDWPHDVECLLEHLNIQKLSVIGVSGGAPYALACAAFSQRIQSVGIVGGVSEFDPRILADLVWWNRWMISLERAFRPAAHLVFSFAARLALSLPSLLPQLGGLVFSKPDRLVIAEPRVRRMTPKLVCEVFRSGIQGPEWDGLLYGKPWDMTLNVIQVPVLLWHGDGDTIVPLAMSRKLEQSIPGARLIVLPGEGHLSLPFRHFPAILQKLLREQRRA